MLLSSQIVYKSPWFRPTSKFMQSQQFTRSGSIRVSLWSEQQGEIFTLCERSSKLMINQNIGRVMIHLHKKYHNKILIYSSNNTPWSSQFQLSSRASSEHHPLNSVEVFRPKSRTSPTLRTMIRLAAVTGPGMIVSETINQLAPISSSISDKVSHPSDLQESQSRCARIRIPTFSKPVRVRSARRGAAH